MKRVLLGCALAFLICGVAWQVWGASAPVAAFAMAPTSPVVNQTVQFTDASTGNPKAWSWTFGDGSKSTLRNPTHVYGSAGTFSVSLTARNGSGSSTATKKVTVSPGGTASGAFRGNIVLGSPTSQSVKVKVLSADQTGTVSLAYGTSRGVYNGQTSGLTLVAGQPLELKLEGLLPDTQYYYRLYFEAPDGAGSGSTEEYAFHTARPTGSTFTFTVQADSHLDGNSDLALYRLTLANVLTDVPDFHIDLGDTFMTEKYSAPLTGTQQRAPDSAAVNARYVYERGNFGLITHSVPLFLANGNHDGELGWLNDGTAQNLAVWATQARLKYFLNPLPDAFYSGDSIQYPNFGQRAAWYAWKWGDALFIVLDPYWNGKGQPGKDAWNLTLGLNQYRWLEATLAANVAVPFKFVFVHNLVGGLDGQMRGGIEAAPYFEWGGKNADGTYGFDQKRSGWGSPIHPLLAKYGVTAVFHGHDHLYANQLLDNIVYQEVPQPSAINSSNGPNLASTYHYASGTILSSSGHLRITVTPTKVTSEYVRAWLPASETAQRSNRQVDHTWTAVPRAGGIP